MKKKLDYNISENIGILFTCSWNYAWGNVDAHLITLFYKKGGFAGLYDFIIKEQYRLSEKFNMYYSSKLPDILFSLKDCTDEHFHNFILDNYLLKYNKDNYITLRDNMLLDYYGEFNSDFRGTIKNIHRIGVIIIFETENKGETYFYDNVFQSIAFNSLDEALIYRIFKGKFNDTLQVLYKSI